VWHHNEAAGSDVTKCSDTRYVIDMLVFTHEIANLKLGDITVFMKSFQKYFIVSSINICTHI
jgi:hypothetical protein